MKRYIFGLLAGVLLLIGVSINTTYACDESSPDWPECAGNQGKVNTNSNKLETPAQKQAACKAKGANDADVTNTANGSCAKAYSCETLFPTTEVARTCNYNRCIAQRGAGADYCICKYGEGGNGLNVGIPLNTTMPFIGRCLKKSDGSTSDTAALDAFPTIVGVASRILVTVIMLVSFIMIIVGGVQRASGDAKAGKAKITKVAIGFALLGMMGAILRLINPNFFK